MTAHGFASSLFALREGLSYVPYGDDDPEPSYAVVDAFTPPHELALPRELCERLRATAARSRPIPSGNGTYYMPDLDSQDRRAIIERFAAVNAAWWALDLDTWHIGMKRYRVGEEHVTHQDLHAGEARRKLAGVVQLSDPDEYAGGSLVVSFAHHRIPMPRNLGTLVGFPGWTVHHVTPVTSGERWMLAVNGRGPRLR